MQHFDEKRKLEAFQYEWMDYPPSLFEKDNAMPGGFSMRKGQKSEFLIPLQEEIDVDWNHESLPSKHVESCIHHRHDGICSEESNIACQNFQRPGPDVFIENAQGNAPKL